MDVINSFKSIRYVTIYIYIYENDFQINIMPMKKLPVDFDRIKIRNTCFDIDNKIIYIPPYYNTMSVILSSLCAFVR